MARDDTRRGGFAEGRVAVYTDDRARRRSSGAAADAWRHPRSATPRSKAVLARIASSTAMGASVGRRSSPASFCASRAYAHDIAAWRGSPYCLYAPA